MPLEEYNHLLSLVKKRRTVRKFTSDPLPEGCIEKIIEIARWAPSGFHTQPWEFLVIKKKEVKEAIIKVLDTYAPPITNIRSVAELPDASQGSFRDAPVFIILLADWRAKVGLPGHPTENNAVVTSIYHSSLARSLSENQKGSRAWGLRGELKARGGGDVEAHR